MQCNMCGAINEEEAIFCISCGNRLDIVAEKPVEASYADSGQPQTAKRGKIPWFVFALGGFMLVLCLAVVGVGAYFLLRDRGSTIAYAVNYGEEVERGLYLMDGDGQNARLLVPMDEDDGGIAYLDWSPNGKYIAYSVVSNEAWEYSLWVVQVNTGETSRIVRDVEGGSFNLFDWSPDSRQIVYSVNQEELRIVNVDGSEDRALIDGTYPFWSPDGDTIAYTNFQEDSAGLIHPDGSEQVKLREDADRLCVPWGWSSDSKWILSHVENEAGDIDIVLISQDGEEEITLAQETDVDHYFPIFSPNGRWMAYISCDYEDGCDVNIVRRDGSERSRLASDAHEESFISWSPDSKSLIYQNEDGEVVRVEIGSGQKTTLTEEETGAAYPVYAP